MGDQQSQLADYPDYQVLFITSIEILKKTQPTKFIPTDACVRVTAQVSFFPIFCCTLFFIDWLNIHHLVLCPNQNWKPQKITEKRFHGRFQKTELLTTAISPGLEKRILDQKEQRIGQLFVIKCRHSLYYTFYHFSSEQVSKWATEIHPEGSSVPHCCPHSLKYLTPPRRLTCG